MGVDMIRIDIDPACCKGCNICIFVCRKAVFVKSKKRNKYGTVLPGASGEKNCVICGLCEKMCPDGAINIENVEEER
jgi:2-oxoglutarate ferredoxin oxidoreductase subunit delta